MRVQVTVWDSTGDVTPSEWFESDKLVVTLAMHSVLGNPNGVLQITNEGGNEVLWPARDVRCVKVDSR